MALSITTSPFGSSNACMALPPLLETITTSADCSVLACVSLLPSGPPSFRPLKACNEYGNSLRFHPACGPPLIQTRTPHATYRNQFVFPSRVRATPHSDLLLFILVEVIIIGFHPAFGPPLIQTYADRLSEGDQRLRFHPAFGPPLIQTTQCSGTSFPKWEVSIPHSGHPSFRQ